MQHIYSNSYLTIAATCSKDSTGGIFRRASPRHIAFPLTAALNGEELLAREQLPHFDGHNTGSYPLLSRAWVLQEQIFSTRVLYFLEHEVGWECNSRRTCECREWEPGLLGDTLTPIKTSLTSIQRSTDADALLDCFHAVVEQYSRRALTYPTDRLPAWASFAKVMLQTMPGNYVAGHWDVAMPLDLLWHVAPGKASVRPREYVAPTWSWASSTAPVIWLALPLQSRYMTRRDWSIEPVGRVMEIKCHSVYSDPCLQVSSGHLIIDSLVVKVEYYRPDLPLSQDKYAQVPVDLRILEHPALDSTKDFWRDYDLASGDEYHLAIGEELYFLIIAHEERRGAKGESNFSGLVLKKVPKEEAYWRIGLAQTRDDILNYATRRTLKIV